jgi:molybdate transport system regulatory protein
VLKDRGLKDTLSVTIDNSSYKIQRRCLELLDWIRKRGSISSACREMGITYKTASSWIKKCEQSFDLQLVISEKGGADGGGTLITERGVKIIEQYYALMSPTRTGFTRSFLELHMSARNILEGTIISTKKYGGICKVDVRLDALQRISAIITKESLTQLQLKLGSKVLVIIKATEPMIMKE